MKTSLLIKNLLFIAVYSILLAPLFNVSPIAVFPVLVAAGMVLHIMRVNNGVQFFDGLAPEVWIPLVLERFYPDNSFLTAAQDMSALVDNDAINFAEIGADPTVLVNNSAYPIAETDASDSPLRVMLKHYDTTSTVVRNAVAVELVYDQRSLYANLHKKALLKRIGIDAANAYAPQQTDAANFNKVLSLGQNDSIIDAVIDMQTYYNSIDDDGTNRNIVFHPNHLGQIAKEDKVLYKAIMATPGSMFYGFKAWTYSQNPIYITATGQKAAQGAAFVPGTHANSSFVFLGSQVMRAMGAMKLFSLLNSPSHKGDVFNFQLRALALPLRNKYQGAILQ